MTFVVDRGSHKASESGFQISSFGAAYLRFLYPLFPETHLRTRCQGYLLRLVSSVVYLFRQLPVSAEAKVHPSLIPKYLLHTICSFVGNGSVSTLDVKSSPSSSLV